MTRAAPLGRLLVLSPHLDDAVFACGALLAANPGATVLTVFGGAQPAGQGLTDWDRGCGFSEGDDIMGARRKEDATALALLHATPRWLDFLDAQYSVATSIATIAQALHVEINRVQPDSFLFPLGLFHTDHLAVHEAAMSVLPPTACYAYEDALYRRLDNRLDERLSVLRRAGWKTTKQPLVTSPHALALKERAILCYRSQLNGLATPGRPSHADLELPEGYWYIEREEMALTREQSCNALPLSY